ncbi:MAG: HDOD domain-containing protein [Hydrogenophilales bacterium]|nr:HDOD domain-containing protein [Hydrogenophilales bacterium]
MITRPLKDVAAWVEYFDQADIPVLTRTQAELVQFKDNEDNLNGRELADAIMHDPLMTLKVLRYLHTHRSKRQAMEITTIAHALMMLGTTPFFRHFAHLPSIESTLKDHPDALIGVMRSMSRARHAALYAQDWAMLRHDMESDEVTIAALLHDLAEILIWCFAPQLMLAIRGMMRADPALRSAEAQQRVLGFQGQELQLALAERWHLPKLLQLLMDEEHADQPRSKNVSLACRLARHAANNWFDAGLPDDYQEIGQLLNLSEDEVHERIQRITLQAAKSWTWYGVAPVAAWLPLLPTRS